MQLFSVCWFCIPQLTCCILQLVDLFFHEVLKIFYMEGHYLHKHFFIASFSIWILFIYLLKYTFFFLTDCSG